MHKLRMEKRHDKDIKYDEDMFRETLISLSKKAGHKYDFILRGGKSLLEVLNKLYKIVWEKERRPDKWKDTLIVQVLKKS